MATLRERNDRWQVMVRRKGQPAVTKTFTERRDAEAWARLIEVEIERGVFVDRSDADKITLGDVLKRYREEVTPLKKGADTEGVRLSALARHKMARLAMSAITSKVIAAYRDERLKTVSGATINRDLNLLSSLINHAVREWQIPLPGNPVSAIRRPRQGRGRERLLDADEEKRLFEAIGQGRNPYLAPVVKFALATAMRRGEMLGLRWGNVDFGKRVARLGDTKNGEARLVPLATGALEVLQGLPRPIGNDSAVFPITPNALKLAWQRACKRAGLSDLHFHDLRRVATTRMAAHLSNVIELASVTGHKTLSMLSVYYKPNASELARKLG